MSETESEGVKGKAQSPSQKALGKRRAVSPATDSALPAKRRRSSSAPQPSRSVIDIDSELAAAGPIDLTESDSELFGNEGGSSDDDELSWVFDRAKERHAAARGPASVAAKEVVDLTADGPSSPVAGSSKTLVSSDGRQFFSQLSCPICMTPPSPLVVTQCGHSFCGPCLHSAMYQQTSGHPGTPQYFRGTIANGRCPVCRTELMGGWGKAIRGCSFKVRRS